MLQRFQEHRIRRLGCVLRPSSSRKADAGVSGNCWERAVQRALRIGQRLSNRGRIAERYRDGSRAASAHGLTRPITPAPRQRRMKTTGAIRHWTFSGGAPRRAVPRGTRFRGPRTKLGPRLPALHRSAMPKAAKRASPAALWGGAGHWLRPALQERKSLQVRRYRSSKAIPRRFRRLRNSRASNLTLCLLYPSPWHNV